MSVYASTPAYAERHGHPKALLLIVGGHAALIAAVMTAKMAVPILQPDPPLVVTPIPIPPDPQPIPEPRPQPQPTDSHIDVPKPPIPVPTFDRPISDPAENPTIGLGPVIGTNPNPGPAISNPIATVVRTGPRFATPNWALRPPYPADKQRLEEEAVLKLRLSIDERGRVVTVEPVGSVDRSFLEAARKHLLAKWRYKPATEDGRPVPSSTVITLRFELERA
jgi:protein TonB